LVLITIVAALVLNFRASGEYLRFAALAISVFGGIGSLSAFAAWRLAQGKGLVAACVLAGFLTLVVIVGWANTGTLQVEVAHPLLGVLRTVDGIYILLLWAAIAWAVRQKGAASRASSGAKTSKSDAPHDASRPAL
jgi:hypothetical protein